jgi:replication initiation and membrane attachment protein DnaB
LVRERYIDQLSPEACALYLFLVTVADAQGLSYYSERSLCRRLSMDELVLHQARRALIQLGLVAYDHPLYQVLALEAPSQVDIPHKHPE